MPALRDFFGSKCPSCTNDILQAEPSTNRMPGPERAWCPSCHAAFTAEQLARKPTAGSILKRLFGGKPRSA